MGTLRARILGLPLLLLLTTPARAGVDLWTPLASPVRAAVTSIVADPGRPATLYATAGGGRAELWKSWNGGATWSLLRGGLDPDLQLGWGLRGPIFDPADSRRLWVWTEFAIWFSADGGRNWTLRHGFTGTGPAFGQLLVDPTTPERLVALSGDSAPLDFLASEDGGASWKFLGRLPRPTLASRLHAHPTDPHLFHVSGSGGLFRSDDGGRSWSLWSTHLDGGFIELVIARSNPETVYAIPYAAPDQLLRSDDGGASWQLTNLSQPRLSAVNPLVDPADDQRVRVVVQREEGFFLLGSHDGGRTWPDEALIVPGSLVVAAPGEEPVLYSGPDFHRSADGGRTWRRQGEEIQAGHVFSLAAAAGPQWTTLYASAFHINSSVLLRSRDSGATWRELPFPGLRQLATDPQRPGRLYGLSSGVYHSDDRGANWSLISPPELSDAAALFVDPARPQRLFVGTLFSGVWRSRDAGRTWRQSVEGLSIEDECDRLGCPSVGPFAVDARDGERVFVVAAGGLYRSLDGGASWRRSDAGLPGASAVAAHPIRRRTLWAGTSEGVFESRDGGDVWRRLAGLSGRVLELTFDARTGHLYAVTERALFRRGSGPGQSWQDVSAGIPEITRFNPPLSGLVVDPRSPGRLYVLVPNLGVWTGRFVGARPLPLPTGRFELRAALTDGERLVAGQPARLSHEGGYFSRLDCGPPELVVKLLDGGGGPAVGLFAGGLTRREVELTVVDRLSGIAETYLMPRPVPRAFADLVTFPAAPLAPPALGAGAPAAAAPATAACAFPEVLIGNRFCAGLRWQDDGSWRAAEGGRIHAGCGGIPAQSAFFWFDRPSNAEVVVRFAGKAGGGFEVFHTALTHRPWELTVSDLRTGVRRSYFGTGRPASAVDSDAFPPP